MGLLPGTSFVLPDQLARRKRNLLKRADMVLLVLGLMIGASFSCDGQVIHWLKVSRAAPGLITEDEADHILQEATQLLQVADTPIDVSTPVTLCLDKGVGKSSVAGCMEPDANGRGNTSVVIRDISGPAEIFDAQDFQVLSSQPGYIKVVKDISYCGGPPPVGPGLRYGGCSTVTPRRSIAVVRIPGDTRLEGTSWAHEYVHTKFPASQRQRHRSDVGALMNATLGANTRAVNVSECQAILRLHSNDPNARSSRMDTPTCSVPGKK